jgi:hypothetical protein
MDLLAKSLKEIIVDAYYGELFEEPKSCRKESSGMARIFKEQKKLNKYLTPHPPPTVNCEICYFFTRHVKRVLNIYRLSTTSRDSDQKT